MLACVLLVACDEATRPVDTFRAPPTTIRKNDCYFEPCLFISAVRYVASARITDLGVFKGHTQSIAYDVNDAGQIVGESDNATASFAMLWKTPTQIQALLTLGGSNSSATGINASGMIAGWSSTVSGQRDGFVWNNGSVLDLTSTCGPYGVYGPLNLNDSGSVVGTIQCPSGMAMAYWPAGTTIAQIPPLGVAPGGSNGFDINNAGTIVGAVFDTTFFGVDSAFTFRQGQQTTRWCQPNAHLCFPIAVSDNGEVAGQIGYQSGPVSAFFVDKNGSFTDLGSLSTNSPNSNGLDLDDSSLVVGQTLDNTMNTHGVGSVAFLWGPDMGMIALPLLPNPTEHFSGAYAINPHVQGDSVFIVGYATASNDTLIHAVLWNVTLGLQPVFSYYPGNFGPVPDTPIIYYNPLYLRDPRYDRYIEAVFLGAPNFDPRAVDISSLRLNGTKVASTMIKDRNGDGYPDLVMLFSVHQLIADGHLTTRSTQLKTTGNYLKVGTPLMATGAVKICVDPKSCPTDNTVIGF